MSSPRRPHLLLGLGLLVVVIALLGGAFALRSLQGPAHPAVAASDPAAAPPETVVLVIACTTRGDLTSPWRNDLDPTPYLGALATRGGRFSETLSNASWTRPAIASLITGRHPLAVGIDPADPGDNFALGLSPEHTTLAQRFSAAGWATLGATANPNANTRLGMARGFDAYADAVRWQDGRRVKKPGVAVVSDLLEQAADVDGPLYLQVVLVDPHGPLEPDRAARARLGLPFLGEGSLLHRYDAGLLRLDDALAALDAGLAAQGRDDRLLVVIGDHGEGLYAPEHADRGHAHHLYDANLSIPWVVHGPGVTPGTVLDGLARSVDLAPTLAGLAGLDPVTPTEGVDHSARLRDGASAGVAREHVAMTRYASVEKFRLTTPDWVLIDNRADGGREVRGDRELYARDDTGQHDERAADQPAVTRALAQRLDARVQALEVGSPRWMGEIDADEQALLEALGYIER